MRHAFALLAISSLLLLSGCPSATTQTTDAAGIDAPGSDTGGTTGTDGGGGASWAVCEIPSDCLLVSAGCCQPCGVPTASDYDGVNDGRVAEHFREVCPAPIPCPRCATQTNPSLVVTCAAARCEVEDLSMLPLSACTADADCVVRWANCCSCTGDATEVVAIRSDSDAAMQALLCDAGTCPLDCVERGDPTYHAVCDPTTSHCAAVPN